MQIELNKTYCVENLDKKSACLNIVCTRDHERASYFEVFRYGTIEVTPTDEVEVANLQAIVDGTVDEFSERDWNDACHSSMHDGCGVEFSENQSTLQHYLDLSEEYCEQMDALMEDDGWDVEFYHTLHGALEVTE